LIIALAALIGFSMLACDDGADKNSGGNNSGGNNSGGNNSGGNNSGGDNSSGNEKSIKITGLDDFYGLQYQLGLATTIDKLYDEDLVAFAEGTIRSGTQTAPLLNYDTGKPWTGSGSYYVGVFIINGKWVDGYVTKTKKSFNNSVTTLSINDFEYAY